MYRVIIIHRTNNYKSTLGIVLTGRLGVEIREQGIDLFAALRDTPAIMNKLFLGPCKAPKGTDTRVASP